MPDAGPRETPLDSPPSSGASASTASPAARPGTNSATGWPAARAPGADTPSAVVAVVTAGISITLTRIIRPALVTASMVARAVVVTEQATRSPALAASGGPGEPSPR